MPDTPAKPKRRWWVRLVRWALLLLVLFLLALSGAAWWIYSRRVVLLNNALTELGPMRGEVGTFEVTAGGGVELHDMVFTDRATGAVMARIPHASGQANLTKLPPDEIRSVTLRKPEITITAAMLEAWRKGAATTPPEVASAPAPILFGMRFKKINIEDARVRVEQADGTSAELTVNYRGEDVDLRPGPSNTGEQELTVEDGAVKTKGEGKAPFDLKKLHVKGRVRDGIVEVADVDVVEPGLHLTPALLAMFGVNLATPASRDSTGATPPVASPVAPPGNVPANFVRGIRVENARLRNVTLSMRGFSRENAAGLILPETEARVSYEAQGIEWHEGDMPVITSQKMDLRDVKIETPDDCGHLRFDSATFDFDTSDNGTHWVIESLFLAKPDVRWTPELRALLMAQAQAQVQESKVGPTQESAKSAPPPPDAAQVPPPASPLTGMMVLLKQGSITDATVDFTDAALMSFELHTKGALMLANLQWDSKGPHSQSFQTLEVTEGRLVFPTEEGKTPKQPWLELPHGEMVVKPDDWNERTRIARLALDNLVVRMRDGNTPWISSQLPGAGSVGKEATSSPVEDKKSEAAAASNAKAGSGEPGDSEQPWWKRINCGQLTLNQGVADMVLDIPKPVDMHAQVDISTQRTGEGGSQHTVRITGFTGKLPTLSPTPFPVAEASVIEGVVRLPEMWTQRRFDELHLTGASVDMGEALMKLFEPEKETASTEEKKAETSADVGDTNRKIQSTNAERVSPWQVGLFSVEDSAVTVSNLVPGMPAVKFGVSLEVKDTPLLAEDLAKSVAPLRVELHNLKIPSPNGTARYVAELDSIFVTFSLGGLMRKEIDGVEIVSPTLFVGEDLFWYVDFYRKYAERGAQPAAPGPQVAANDDALEQKLAGEVAAAEPPVSQASWSVKRLQVHSGKLVLAPKGVPLKGFHTPFPFHIDSEVKRGTLEADMEIPHDTYELPNVNLQFVGMTGRVQFNLPLKQKDNNLVETFQVDSIRYEKLKTGKAYLTVTYDSAGIYAKFGADAYEGYLSGEFNLYTDDSFHWDGWVNGKNVQTHELTRILCPGYFIMDGRVEATLVAQGSRDELYQADGSFKNHTPGVFTINALNGLIKDLPKDWDPMKAQITKIGLETLRDFKYDHADMKCRFYGREGNGRMSFTGPAGSRNFDINVYDHRWRTDEEGAVKVTAAGSEGDDRDNDQ